MTKWERVKAGDARVVGVERLRGYEEAADLAAPAIESVALARHVRAAAELAIRGEDALARGAAHVAAVTALRLATTPSRTEGDHQVRMAALDQYVSSLSGLARVHIAALLEIRLWTEAELLVATGLRPHRRVPLARDVGIAGAVSCDGLTTPDPGEATPDDLVRYGVAVASADADFALSKAVDVLRDLIVLPKGGYAANGAWIVLDAVAFGLCVEPATSHEARLDVRRPLLILWRTVRRRRPLTGAVLRRRILLDRERWPGPRC